jgi:hypothetical protein
MTLRNRRWLGAAILIWTLVAWGGRVALLSAGDDLFDIARIGGSLLIGLVAALVLWMGRSPVWRPVLYVFAGWTSLLWARSMWVNWSGSGTLAFKLVHTALALGFAVLVIWSLALARGDLVPGPDEADGQEKGQSEASPIAKG